MSGDPFDRLEPLSPEGAGFGGDGGPESEAVEARIAEAAGLALNDTGNGRRFALHFGEDLIHVPRVGWHVWDGTRWRVDPDEIGLRAMAQELAPLIAGEVRHLRPSAQEEAMIAEEAAIEAQLERGADAAVEAGLRHRLRAIEAALKGHRSTIARRLTHARNAGNSNAMSNFTREAAVLRSRPLETLDAAALEVNTLSGVLRFAVDRGEGYSPVSDVRLLPHDRGRLTTKLCPVVWEEGAPRPRFDDFLARVQPAAEMRGFLQRWYGLCLTALTGEQKLVFNYGGGANGKSVMQEVIARLLGDYAASARIESLIGRSRRGGGDATPDLVPLIGARFVRASEPELGETMNEAVIKELTGGEPILIRALHSDFVEVRPVAKISISGNHKPQVRGTDDGIWRRLLLVPWDVQIPVAERDPDLAARLVAEEGPGIFAWMVEGLLDYLEGGLREPAQVLDATREYREESDPVGCYIDACCVVTGQEGDVVKAADLADGFNLWRMKEGESQWRPGTVSRALKAKAGRWRSAATGRSFAYHKRSTSVYVGLRLQDPFAAELRNAPRGADGRLLAPRLAQAGDDDE